MHCHRYLWLSAVLWLAGCSHFTWQWPLFPLAETETLPFSHDLRQAYQLNEEDLRSLQYYLSHEITLVREATSGEMQIAQGRLVTRAGKQVEEIVIPAGTPGVAVAVGENWLDISFAPGTALRFGSDPGRRALWEGKYSLLGVAWQAGPGLVPFAGKVYYSAEASGSSYLLIGKQFFYQTLEQRQTLRGLKL